MKKAMSLILALAMLISVLSGMSLSASAATTFEVDTIAEAEKADDANDIEKVKDKTASGSNYMVFYGMDRLDDPTVNKKADLSWDINIPADGVYSVHIRMNIESGTNDSFHYWWDNAAFTTLHPGETSGFKWIKIGSFELKAGKHTFNWTHRETEAYVDCIFVTTDDSKVPQEIEGVEKPTPAPTPDRTKSEVYTYAGNGIEIEAEKGGYTLPYREAKDSAASGKAYLVGDGDKPATDPKKAESGDVEYTFTVSESANYSFWFRLYSADMGADSVYVEVDEIGYTQYQPDVYEDWVWCKVLVTSLEPGTHVFKVKMREAGMMMDKLVITDKPFTPTGMGEVPENLDDVPMPTIKADYPVPEITPPAEHPRLIFREKDIAAIKANMSAAQNENAANKFYQYLDNETTGMLSAPANGGSNIDTGVLNTLQAYAFDYAINGNAENGKKAVDGILNYLSSVSTVGDATRGGGYVIFVTSEIYDWCYDLLDQSQKRTIITYCETLASLMEIGWPPVKQGAVVGHAGEAQLERDLLSFAIAVYDERPDIWNVVAGRYYSEYIDARNFINQAHFHHQGDSYGPYRHSWDSYSQMILSQMGAPAPLNDDLYKMMYATIYMRRPDGQLLRDGDTTADTTAMWNYWTMSTDALFLDSAMGADPYIKNEYFRSNVKNASFLDNSPIIQLVLNDPNLEGESIYKLPLSRYFGSPMGVMVARTGWEDGIKSPAVVCEMKVGEWWFTNHHQLDAGHFQIYYKGVLASDSGIYEGAVRASKVGETNPYGDTDYGSPHDLAYAKRTIAHNSMLVYDPGEKDTMTYYGTFANDGGQKILNNGNEPMTLGWMKENGYNVNTVEAQEFGPDVHTPAYTYMKGDLTGSYTDKVSDYKRSFMFLNLFDDEVPAALIVFDKIDSSKDSFKKTWLLHSVEEPEIKGSQTIIRRTYSDDKEGYAYNGKMICDTLLPKADDVTLTKVGGEGSEFMVDGTNYFGYDNGNMTDEGTGWRVEVSPKKAKTGDFFLNVMQVSDNDKEYYLDTKLIENDMIAGVAIADRVVTFSKTGKEIEDNLVFTNDGEGNWQYTVCDMKAGSWNIAGDNGYTGSAVASEDGGVVYFEAPAGTYTLTYASADANKKFTDSGEPDIDGIYLRVSGNRFLYSDVAPRIINDRTLVPMRVIFEHLGAEVVWDEATASATASTEERTVTITRDNTTAYIDGDPVTLDVPATIIDGRFLVPVRFVAESFGAKVEWDSFSKTVFITPGKIIPKVKTPEGYAKIVNSEADEYSEQYFDTNAWDQDYATIWSAQGYHYIDFELDGNVKIENIEVALNPNSNRTAKFEVLVSQDGENFTSVGEYLGDGFAKENTFEVFTFPAPVSAKYVRYYAKGSNISDWNGVKEIRFKLAQ